MFRHNGRLPATLAPVLLNKGHRKLKESSKTIVENLLHLSLSRNGSGKYGDALPLRSLFSAEQDEAAWQDAGGVSTNSVRDPLQTTCWHGLRRTRAY